MEGPNDLRGGGRTVWKISTEMMSPLGAAKVHELSTTETNILCQKTVKRLNYSPFVKQMIKQEMAATTDAGRKHLWISYCIRYILST